jgi:hypothetical protein
MSISIGKNKVGLNKKEAFSYFLAFFAKIGFVPKFLKYVPFEQ